MKILNIFSQDFNSTISTLRDNYSQLSKSKESVIQQRKNYEKKLKEYQVNKDYFSKSAIGKPILENIEKKWGEESSKFLDFLKTQEKLQSKLEKGINKIYQKNTELLKLRDYNKIIPENKFNELLVVLTKAHKDQIIGREVIQEKIKDLRSYRRVDFEKGSVYVKDDRIHYSDCIVINELNEVLLLKRNKLDDFEPAKYCLPGGHVDPGEDFEYAALRELIEETGIKGSTAIPSGEYSDNKVVIHYFTVQVKKNECNIFLDEREHQQFEWVSMEDLPKYPLIKNLDKNFENTILIPTWVINTDLAPNIFKWDNSGEVLRDEIVEKMILANELYKSFITGDIEKEEWKNFIKENNLEVQPFTLYKSTSKPLYGLKLTNSIEKSGKIEGGLADGKTIEELAAHHKVSIKKIYDEIEIGKKVEMEHTDDPEKVLEITMDHLWEIPDYYTRLKEMEKEAKEDKLEKAYSHKYLRREGSPGNYKYFYADETGKESFYEETESVIDRIIKALNKPIQQITEKIEKHLLEKKGGPLTDYDKEIIRLSLLSDLISSLGKYIKKDDELKGFQVNISNKGNFQINAKLNREGQDHHLVTDAIYAEGPVQQLHLRYITKTSLPMIKTSVPNKYAEELKKLKKEEKIQKDISDTKTSILRLQQKVDESKTLTDEQILDKDEHWQHFKNTTWEDLVERGADKNFKDRQEFEESQDKYKQSIIDHFKRMITFKEESIISMKKTVDKLEKKLEKEDSGVFEKGQKAEVGEIREWSGVKMQKTAQGWVPVKHDNKTSNKEDKETPKSVEKPEEQKEYSEKELEEFARKSSEQDLKTAATGEDEKLRIAAKKELDRREREEVPGESSTEDNIKGGEVVSTDLTKKIMEDKVKSLTDKFSKIKGVDEKKQVARYIRRVNDFLKQDTQANIKTFSKSLGVTEPEVKELFGDGEILGLIFRKDENFKKGVGSVDVNILTKDMCCSRLFDFTNKRVVNEEFLLDVDLEKGKGKGAEIFINQVEQFKKLGLETMETIACRTEGSQNGYYTWARLGYDIRKPSPSYDEFLNTIKGSDSKEINNSKSLQELMSFDEGRKFWREYGFTFAGVFDLKDNSNSMKILKAYQQNKK